MAWLYHRVPEGMRGNILYPLNELKNVYLNLYKLQLSKYEIRKHVLDYTIPTLHCLWNDALHLTAVNPKKISEKIQSSGFHKPFKWKFFKINSKKLNLKLTTVYKFMKTDDPSKYHEPKQFVKYDAKNTNKLSKISKNTLDYWKTEVAAGRKPLMFMFIPHILYKGSIDVSDAEIIEV